MARQNVPLLGFNRGIISPKALARVDLDRTALSAAEMTNWLPRSQGSMSLRPGTKYCGNSLNDTGAALLEFVAATDDTALIELTHQKMRIWLESDTGNYWETPAGTFPNADVPLARPLVATTLSLSDTGWSDASTGGAISSGSQLDVIPTMTSVSPTNGVEITASSQNPTWGASGNGYAYFAADDNTNPSAAWVDTGEGSKVPTWWNADFDTGGNDTGSWPAVTSYSIKAHNLSESPDHAPQAWRFITANWDTGTYATDTGKWTLVDERSAQTGWAVGERRSFTRPDVDTGTVEPHRHWRLYFTTVTGGGYLALDEIEMFTAKAAQHVQSAGGKRIFNATSIGALAKLQKRVIVDTGDLNVEHSLDIDVERGPIVFRVGSSSGDDDYVGETRIGTGHHNIAFTPAGDFHITLQSDLLVDRIIRSMEIGDSGTVEITIDPEANDLDNVRYDQSADVVYVDCEGLEPHKIERRGTGRSWSWVELNPDNGPFLPAASSTAKLSVSQKYGNTIMNSDVPFFKPTHASGPGSSLFRLFHEGQSGLWPLGALNAKTDAIKVTGIADTGDNQTTSQGSERRINVSVSGVYAGKIRLERSFEGPEAGFHPVSTSAGYIVSGDADDTGTFTRIINDRDDNAEVWYRAKMVEYTSGAALVTMTHPHGGVFGIARITGYNSNTSVDIEVLSRFSDTGPTDVWQEGRWSGAQQHPSSVALHGGRLAHAGGANLDMSASDDYENFDLSIEGDAAPISRTLGSGPVDNIYYLVSLLRLIVGTSGAEIEIRSSSLDEPLTPTNSSARQFSTQGSANLRAVKMDTSAIFTQRSGKRVFMIGQSADEFGGYNSTELTMLAPDLLEAGVVDIAIQRQPDTRIHCVLADGKVGILTYEPQEEVMCWSMWETSGSVEKAAVLPGSGEDKVYYHVNRTINGATKRFLERWATEAETEGDTGLTWLADCAASYTDGTRTATLDGIVAHLPNTSVVVCGDDTGNSYPFKDYSPDVAGVQTTYTADTGGDVALTGTDTVHHAVVGIPYQANWTSTKLAYASEGGTALGQAKRVAQIAFVLYKTHNNGLFFGNDTGQLDALPRMIDRKQVDAREIFEAFETQAIPFPGKHDRDARVRLRAKSPRPATVMAAIPGVQTNDRV